ncbi:MAG TPA: ECF-type sigma factor [Bryobacteraceae bacterium]|nr:ECF-type sigma factor [Bryobacteraceae bacterium]
MSTLRVCTLFEKVREGDADARDALYEISFSRLRLIAASLLSRERRCHTLQPTALVGELFFKLRGFEHRILDEDHFFGVAARAMRQVLIDHARVRKAAKKIAPELVPELLASRTHANPELRLTVKTVFQALRRLDPRAAETVWLRSVEELTLGEVSRRQGREVWRVRADYDFGTRWMADRIRP